MQIDEIVTEIKKLSEMDFTSLLESIHEHADKNNWVNAVNSVFRDEEEIDALNNRIDNLVDDKNELEAKIEDIKRLIE